jgi:hypothetical protein
VPCEAHLRFAIVWSQARLILCRVHVSNAEPPEKASQLYRGFSFQLKGFARHTRTALSPIDRDGQSTVKPGGFLGLISTLEHPTHKHARRFDKIRLLTRIPHAYREIAAPRGRRTVR